MRIHRIHFLMILLALCLCAIPFRTLIRGTISRGIQPMTGGKSIADRVAEFGSGARHRLAPDFHRIGVSYPPARMTLVGIKAERSLQVWVAGPDDGWKHLKDYPILGASGTLGPKLREGDRQVPEGVYKVESLNPNSRYHLALRVSYPNPDDRRRGQQDGRTALGSDIMIHGNTGSVGCLAMGDTAAEDLFVLAAETGTENISIILSPVDFRKHPLPAHMPPTPAWTGELYKSIKGELEKLDPPPPDTGRMSVRRASLHPPENRHEDY